MKTFDNISFFEKDKEIQKAFKAGIEYQKDTMSQWIDTQIKDSVVQSVINKFKQRSEVGIKKYNTTLDREDLDFGQWVEHAIEESMDFTLYLYKIKQQWEQNKKI